MKTKLFLIAVTILFLFSQQIQAQDRGPKTRKLKLNGQDSIELKSTVGYFRGPDSLVVGFQWPNNLSVANAVYANHNALTPQFTRKRLIVNGDTTYPIDSDKAPNGAYMTLNGLENPSGRYTVYSHCIEDTALLQTKSLSFKPNMKIDTGDNQYKILAKRPYDKSRPIFGFKYVHPEALANNPLDSGNLDYGCLLIDNQSFNNDTIFKGPWGIEYLRKYLVDSVDINSNAQKYFYGYNFYISITLKSTSVDYYGTIPGSPVLEIKLPYTLYNGSKGFIKFDALPTTRWDSIKSSFNEYRGQKTGLYDTNAVTTSFVITDYMLHDIDSLVTIKARFRCWGMEGTDPKRNPRLSSLFGHEQTDIKDLDIIAIYKGCCPIGIESISILSPHTLDLLEGKCDTRICNWLQQDIDCFNSYNSALPEKKLKIFKFNDITEANVQNYAAARYIRELIGDVFSGSNSPTLPVLFDHYVQPSSRVYGFGYVSSCMNAPYIKQGQKYDSTRSQGLLKDRWKSMGFISGSTQKNNWAQRLTLEDQLNSGYETFYPWNGSVFYNYADFNSPEPDESDIYNLKATSGNDSPFNSFQTVHQYNLWYLYYNKTNSGFQYLDKPWYFQTQNLIEWTKAKYTFHTDSIEWTNLDLNSDSLEYSYRNNGDSVDFYASTIDNSGRPFTAEELRAITYSALVQGAKGLFYDGLSYNGRGTERGIRSAHNDVLLEHPLGATEDRYEYLMRDEFGGDFFDFTNEADPTKSLYFQYLPALYVNMLKSTVDKESFMMENLGVSYNRVYIGRKSTRIELYKIHRLLMENASAFIDMKLMAWFGKGIFKTYNQHPSLDTNECFLNRYVDTSHITTRKIFQPHTNLLDSIYTTVPYTTLEPEEEQFYDLTLFQCGTDDINLHHTIGIQNRRTDPLRLRYTGVSLKPKDLFFYTSAEMDYFSDHGGKDPLTDSNQTPDYWRKIYRQSLGYREISLPIRRLRELTDSWGYLVKDLTYIYPKELSTMKYWMQDAYDHQIYQFVGSTIYKSAQYDTINCKLRPAEAKFLDIKRFYKFCDIQADIVRKIPPPSFPPPPPPPTTPFDTCEILTNGMGLFFKKCDTTDANNCLYEIYFINKSDSCNFYVPLIVDFQSENKMDTVIGVPSGFQNIHIRRYNSYQSIWLPDSILTDTTFLGYYKPNCTDSRITYKLGTSDCYSTKIIDLRCGICACCDSVEVDVAPIQPLTLCRLFALPSQRITLNTGENCNYYGMTVTGGFEPQDTQPIPDLDIPLDTLAPIDLSTYKESIADPFMFIPYGGSVTYCLNFSFLGKNGLELCKKEFCLSINTAPNPNIITPTGIISSQCYATVPAKQTIPSEENHAGQKIIVDPNPTTGKANVKLNLENDLVGRLVLYTSSGELIKEIYNGKLPAGTSDYQIDLSSQPSGMYIITIESDGMQYIKKFVKE
ncbi:MAG: T9SS type A sorting domain-containing protein [bacterium]